MGECSGNYERYDFILSFLTIVMIHANELYSSWNVGQSTGFQCTIKGVCTHEKSLEVEYKKEFPNIDPFILKIDQMIQCRLDNETVHHEF